MIRIEWHESSGETEIPGKGLARDHYARGAFSKIVGQRVPYRAVPGGPQAGWVTIISVVVDEDGLGATWTADFDLNVRRGPPIRGVPVSQDQNLDEREAIAHVTRASFSFRQDLPGSAAAVIRDPLAAKPPVIRRREN